MEMIWKTLLVLIALGVASCFIFYMKKEIRGGFSASDLIGIMSLLVTILIGWNIYNALEVNRKIDKIDARIDSVSRNTEKNLQSEHESMQEVLRTHRRRIFLSEEYCMGCVTFIQAGTEKDYLKSYKLYVTAILRFCRCGEQATENRTIIMDNMEGLLNLIEKNKPDLLIDLDGSDEYNRIVGEIRSNDSDEFLFEQRDRFYEIEKKRKLIIKSLMQ